MQLNHWIIICYKGLVVNSLGPPGRPVNISGVASAESAAPHDLLWPHGTRTLPCTFPRSFKFSSCSFVSSQLNYYYLSVNFCTTLVSALLIININSFLFHEYWMGCQSLELFNMLLIFYNIQYDMVIWSFTEWYPWQWDCVQLTLLATWVTMLMLPQIMQASHLPYQIQL